MGAQTHSFGMGKVLATEIVCTAKIMKVLQADSAPTNTSVAFTIDRRQSQTDTGDRRQRPKKRLWDERRRKQKPIFPKNNIYCLIM